MRVVLSSSDPVETLHNFRTGRYSVITLLDMLEMLDVKETMADDIEQRAKRETSNTQRMGNRKR